MNTLKLSWVAARLILLIGFEESLRAVVSLNVGNVVAEPGTSVTLPITVTGFSRIVTVQFTVEWNAAVLQFVTTGEFGLRGLGAGNFGSPSLNKLTFSWDDPDTTGVSLTNGSKVFSLQFVALGASGTSSLVSITAAPTPIEISDDTANLVSFGLVNGSFNAAIKPAIDVQPISRTNSSGTLAAFTVVASGTPPLSYHWKKDGSLDLADGGNISGAGGSTLTISGAQSANAGSYQVIVTNIAGAVTSAIAGLTIVSAPAITQQPVDMNVKLGAATNLTVAASGSGLSYQWFQDGSPVANLDGKTATLSLLKTVLTQSGSYFVEVSNAAGTIRSSNVVLKVYAPPAISGEPAQTVVVTPNNSLALTAQVNGTQPLNYQWLFNGIPIAAGAGFTGDHAATLSKAAATSGDSGSYSLLVTNFGGSSVRKPYNVFVGSTPFITLQPSSRTVATGSNVTFTVGATGSSLRYQWRKGSLVLGTFDTPSFTVANAQNADAENYSVNVTNSAGAVLSGNALLTVLDPVVITSQPVGKSLLQIGYDWVLSVKAKGDGPIGYQWLKNNTPAAGAVDKHFELSDVTAAAAGSYTVIITNAVSSVTSQPALITVLGPPVLSGLPSIVILNTGQSSNLTVTASGAGGPFSFEWRRNGVMIPGSQNTGIASTFTFANATATDGGIFSVIASSQGGGATESNPAIVHVTTNSVPMSDALETSPTNTAVAALFTATNAQFTAQVGEPAHFPGKNARKSAWLTWIAPANGRASFTTLGSDFDTILAVYTNALPLNIANLKLVGSDNNDGGFLTSRVDFNARAGAAYRIAVDGVNGGSGQIVISWNLIPSAFNAPDILAQPVSFAVTGSGTATFTVNAALTGSGTIEYQWLRNGQVFTDGGKISGTGTSQLTITDAGSIDVGGYSVRLRNLSLPSELVFSDTAYLTFTPVDGGKNEHVYNSGDDLFGDSAQGDTVSTGTIHLLAAVTNLYSSTLVFPNIDGIKSPGEPNHCGEPGGSPAWTFYDPPTNGLLRVTTDGSTIDTVIAAYTQTGISYSSLVLVNCDNNSGLDGLDSLMTFPVVQGTRYFLVVDGVHGARGTIQLNKDLIQPPVILSQAPSNQSVPLGGTLTLAATASNGLANVPLAYQWKFNGADLLGATNTSLTVSNLTLGSSGAYALAVVNIAGTVTTRTTIVTVLEPVTIVNNPQTISAAPGSSGSFSVSAIGTAPLHYQWSLNTIPLLSQTNPILSFANVQVQNAGLYQVTISNAVNIVSAQASLILNVPLTIVSQPISQTVAAGSNVTFSVVVTGTPPFGYQWMFQGAPIAGANNASLILTNAVSGDYSVLVTNSTKAVASSVASLNVIVPVSILQPPQSQVVELGGASILQVSAAGTPPLSYQWRFRGAAMTGATNASLALSNIQTATLGAYSVTVTNSISAVTSLDAVLSLNGALIIVQQPASQTVQAGSNATFQVVAQGTGLLSYHWRQDDRPIPGATNALLTLINVSAAHAGVYQVVVNSDSGSLVSSNATLQVDLLLALSLVYLPGASINLTARGPAGKTFNLEASTNLTVWSSLASNVAFLNKTFSFVEPASTNTNRRFYRMRQD